MSKPHILHIQQAKLNEEAAKIAAQSECYDWAVTMCFYAALHYVEGHAVFNQKDIYLNYSLIASTQHTRRIAYVEDVSYAKYGDMLRSASYETLYTASMKARYMENIRCYSRKYFQFSCNRYFQELSKVKDLVQI